MDVDQDSDDSEDDSELILNETSVPADESESSDSDQDTEEVLTESFKIPVILDGTFFKIKSQQKNSNNSKVDNVLAQCIFCKGNFKGTLTATSNFLSHLKKKHVGDFKRYEEYKKKTYIPPSKKKKFIDTKLNFNQNLPVKSSALQQHFKSSNQKIATEAIARYIVQANCPLRTVELPAFKDLIKIVSKMGSEVTCPTRVTTTKSIANLMTVMKEKIILEIKENKYFCTTADMWSAHRKSYIGMSFKTKNRNYIELLFFKIIFRSHNSFFKR